MTRTNIDIDDALIGEVMNRHRLETKRTAVDFALRSLISQPMTRAEILTLRGSGIEFANDNVERGWALE